MNGHGCSNGEGFRDERSPPARRDEGLDSLNQSIRCRFELVRCEIEEIIHLLCKNVVVVGGVEISGES